MLTFVSKQISYSEPEKILNKNPSSPEMVTNILGYKGLSVIAIDKTKRQLIKNLTISKITDSSYEKSYDGIEFLDRSTRAEAIEQTGESIIELDLSGKNTGQINTTGISTEHTEGTSTEHTEGTSTEHTEGISTEHTEGTSTGHTEGTSTGHTEGTLEAHMDGSSDITETGTVITKEISIIAAEQKTFQGGGIYEYEVRNTDVTLPPVGGVITEELHTANDIVVGNTGLASIIPMESILESESSGTSESDTTGTSESDSTGTFESDSTGTSESDSTGTSESDSTGTFESDSTGTSESDSTGTSESNSTVDLDSVARLTGYMSNLRSRTPAKNIFLYNAFNFNYSQKSIETIISCKLFFVAKGFLYELLKNNSSPVLVNGSSKNISELSDENPMKQFTNRKEDYKISFHDSISLNVANEYFSYITTISTSDISSYNYEIPVDSSYDYILLIPEASPKSFNQKKPKLEVFYKKLLADTLAVDVPPTEEGNFTYPSGESLPQNVGDYAALFNHLNKNGVEFFVNKYSEFVQNFYEYNSVNEDLEIPKLYTLKNIHATINLNLEEEAA